MGIDGLVCGALFSLNQIWKIFEKEGKNPKGVPLPSHIQYQYNLD
jgi:hypothetical protein